MGRAEATGGDDPRGWTAAEYVAALHPPGSRGDVTLLAREGVGLRSRTHPADDARSPVILGVYEEAPAAYVAMTRYHGPRGGGRRIAELSALWLDLDTHRVERLRGVDPETLAARLVADADRRGLPRPSLVISSGRGLYAIWLTTPAPARAETRWRAGMRTLVELHADWGADPACVDPARVLRIVGSVSDKNGRPVRVVWGDAARHGFDDLLDRVYASAGRPTRAELSRRRQASAARTSRPRPPGAPRPPSRWPAVIRDLERVRAHYSGRIPTGLRDLWIHLRAAALAHVTAPADILPRVLSEAATAAPWLDAREIGRWIGPTIRRAADAAAGRRNLRGADPRYAYSGARMAEILGVDEAMARALGLEQIMPQALRAARRTERRREARRAAGVMPRALWLAANPLSRTRPWEADGVSRATWYRRQAARREARIRAARRGLLSAAAPMLASRETGPVRLYGGGASPRDRARRPSGISGPPHPIPAPAGAAAEPAEATPQADATVREPAALPADVGLDWPWPLDDAPPAAVPVWGASWREPAGAGGGGAGGRGWGARPAPAIAAPPDWLEELLT